MAAIKRFFDKRKQVSLYTSMYYSVVLEEAIWTLATNYYFIFYSMTYYMCVCVCVCLFHLSEQFHSYEHCSNY